MLVKYSNSEVVIPGATTVPHLRDNIKITWDCFLNTSPSSKMKQIRIEPSLKMEPISEVYFFKKIWSYMCPFKEAGTKLPKLEEIIVRNNHHSV